MGIFLFGLFGNWAYDDPFITYRYADNLRRGVGFVYNPGEKVLSTTTPLFALMLALLGQFWLDLHVLANFLGVIALVLGGVFLWDLGHKWKTPAAGWAALLLYPTFPLLVTTLGSETPLYLALCIGAFAFYARKRYLLVGLFAALAILTRPDGALVPVILGIDYFLRAKRPIPRKALLIFLLLVLSWFVFAWIYFGTPIPATLATKQSQGEMAISQHFAPGIKKIVQNYFARWNYWIEALLAGIGLVYIGWKARRWTSFIVWPVAYFVSYTILGVTGYFWYYAPLVPGFVALVGLGITAVSGSGWLEWKYSASGTTSKTDRVSIFRARLSHIVVGLLVVFLFGFQVSDLWRVSVNPDKRFIIYRAVGEWLQVNTSPDDTIGVLEVGIIGYYAQRQMVDFAGLIQPQVAKTLSENTTYEDAAIWAVNNYQVDFLVLPSGAFPRLEAGFVTQYCQQVTQFPGEQFDHLFDLDIFSCTRE